MKKRILSVILIGVIFLSYLFVPINIVAETNKETLLSKCEKSKIKYYYVNQETSCVVETEDDKEFKDDLILNDKVSVLFELSCITPICNCRDRITKDSTLEEVEQARSNHKEEMKEFFHLLNEKFVELNEIEINSEEYDITIAEYAPYIMMTFDDYSEYLDCETQIIAISDNDIVNSVSVSETVEYPSANRENVNDSSYYNMYFVKRDIDALSQTYNGNGIKVGIIEAEGVAYSSSHSDLENLNITVNKPSGVNMDEASHAIKVTRVLCGENGIAPGVRNVYIYYSNTPSSMVNALEWMVEKDVNIINISKETDGWQGLYNWTGALLDFYVRTYFFTCVASAGNEGSQGISNYGMGENVITVAATNMSNNIATFSAYGMAESINLRKPTLAAPGVNIAIGTDDIGSGTSFSAPIVAGVVAKLMDEDPFLILYPEAVTASLIVSATSVNGQNNAWDIDAGAGRISYEKAREAVGNCIVFSNRNNSIGIIESERIAVSANERLKVAAVWLANSETEGAGDSVCSNNHTNYDLHLMGVNITRSVFDSNRSTNTEYINIYNTSTATFDINILQRAAIVSGEEDVGAFTWITE